MTCCPLQPACSRPKLNSLLSPQSIQDAGYQSTNLVLIFLKEPPMRRHPLPLVLLGAFCLFAIMTGLLAQDAKKAPAEKTKTPPLQEVKKAPAENTKRAP